MSLQVGKGKGGEVEKGSGAQLRSPDEGVKLTEDSQNQCL